MDSERRHSKQPVEAAAKGEPGRPVAVRDEKKKRSLLDQGWSLYRESRYEQAIHIWTRVFFLERGAPQAREAIEAGKKAIAERQRQLDLKVVEAANRLRLGERQRALRVLKEVIAVDPRHAEALSLLLNAEAQDRRVPKASNHPWVTSRSGSSEGHFEPARKSSTAAQRRRDRRSRTAGRPPGEASTPLKKAAFLFAAFCLFAAGGLYLHLNWDFLVSDREFISQRRAEPAFEAPLDPLLLPAPEDFHYLNGARLYKKGQFRKALRELSRVERGSPVAEQARRLILRIEERLLRESSTRVQGKDHDSSPFANGSSPAKSGDTETTTGS